MLQKNLERLQRLIETFCEQMSTSVVTPLAELASKPEISFAELTDCWRNSWTQTRDLLTRFEDGMWFYRDIDAEHVGVYYTALTTETIRCIIDLSDVVKLDRSEWASKLKHISANFRAALSLDVTSITFLIRQDLQILRSLNANSLEGP